MRMKRLIIVTLLALSVMILARVGTTMAQDQISGNLLTNPGFEEGHFNQNGLAEIVVPNGWRLHYLDQVTFPGAWDNLPALRPESVVWNISGAPESEKDLFWRDGVYTLKVFKSWAPMYAALSQDVSGLEVGRRYRLVAPIYPDIVEDYSGGGKVPPSRPSVGQVRLGASPVGAAWRDENAINYSAWWTGATVSPFYQAYPVFVHEFTATQPDMTVWIEFRSTYPYPNNGFFLDTMGLYALDAVDNNVGAPPPSNTGTESSGASAQPVPTFTPLPTPTPRADGAVVHQVQSGDTLWTIAIQYAETMGLTPENALPTIQELNNNPAFISVGQELVIVPPQAGEAEDAAPAGDDEEGDTAVTASEEAESETEAAETEAGATEEAAAEETAADTETAAVASEPEATIEEAATAAETAPQSNGVCVAAFNDANGDGVHDATEGYLADAAVSLYRDGRTEATYVTDGINEPYCFQDLEADTYQVQIFPPADHAMTTTGSWAVAVSGGMSIAVEFGVQHNPEAVAVAAVNSEETAVEPVAAAADGGAETAATAEGPAAEESGDFLSNVGLIVLGVAVVLVLLAGVGVFLLRQS